MQIKKEAVMKENFLITVNEEIPFKQFFATIRKNCIFKTDRTWGMICYRLQELLQAFRAAEPDLPVPRQQELSH